MWTPRTTYFQLFLRYGCNGTVDCRSSPPSFCNRGRLLPGKGFLLFICQRSDYFAISRIDLSAMNYESVVEPRGSSRVNYAREFSLSGTLPYRHLVPGNVVDTFDAFAFWGNFYQLEDWGSLVPALEIKTTFVGKWTNFGCGKRDVFVLCILSRCCEPTLMRCFRILRFIRKVRKRF